MNRKVAISEEVQGQMLLVKDKGFDVFEKLRIVIPVPLSAADPHGMGPYVCVCVCVCELFKEFKEFLACAVNAS